VAPPGRVVKRLLTDPFLSPICCFNVGRFYGAIEVTSIKKYQRSQANRDRALRFVDRLVRIGELDWARRARTRSTVVYVLRYRRRFDDLGPHLRVG
jgi:hypothetical protein